MTTDGNLTTALLIIDVQNDFCPGGALAVAGGDAIIPLINRLSAGFPGKVVATQDWHPRGHVSFASRYAGKQPFDTVETDAGSQILWPDHCVQGSDGAALHPGLDVTSVDLILRKGTNPDLDSYSAFYENDHRTPTGLAGYLNALGVTRVWVCGLATDVCVYFTVNDALDAGLEVTVVDDAVRGVDQPRGSLAAAVERMKHRGALFAAAGEPAG